MDVSVSNYTTVLNNNILSTKINFAFPYMADGYSKERPYKESPEMGASTGICSGKDTFPFFFIKIGKFSYVTVHVNV